MIWHSICLFFIGLVIYNMEISYTANFLPLRFVGEGNSAIDVPMDYLELVKEFYAPSNLIFTVFLIKTGIKIEIPYGYNGLLKLRSGAGLRLRESLLNYTADSGLIDASYRGELLFYFTTETSYSLNSEEGIEKVRDILGIYPLQLMIHKIEQPSFNMVETLGETWRNEGGFGSTG
jgi:dUTPase